MKIVQFMWNIVKQYFYQKEMSYSEEEVLLTLEAVLDHPPLQIFMSVVQKGCLRADVSYFLCCTRATKEIGDVCTQATKKAH